MAAVKISSVRRKAAQKFWAPQQDHRPLQNPIGKHSVGAGFYPARPGIHRTPCKTPCHCEASAHTGCGNPHLPSPNPPLPKERGILAGYGVFVCRKLVRGFPQKETAFSGGLRLSKNPPVFSDKRLAVCCAHNLSVCDGQIPHWQPELYFLSRTCRERK